MNINMDDELRRTRSKFQNDSAGASVSKWVLIVAFGVFLGTTSSTLAIRAIDNAIVRYELHEMNKKLAAEQARMKARQVEQNKINAARSKLEQIENEKKQAGYRQALETCNFWKEQYNKERSAQNKMHLDESCRLVNEFR